MTKENYIKHLSLSHTLSLHISLFHSLSLSLSYSPVLDAPCLLSFHYLFSLLFLLFIVKSVKAERERERKRKREREGERERERVKETERECVRERVKVRERERCVLGCVVWFCVDVFCCVVFVVFCCV